MNSHFCVVLRTVLFSTSSSLTYLIIFGILLQRTVTNEILKSNIDANFKKCSNELSLENREENAEIIFSGTIQHLFSHAKNNGHVKALVKIKRVFKGNALIGKFTRSENHRMVAVNGLHDRRICDSLAKLHDTRIFLVNEIGSELKLNSSLIKISLENLEHVEAAVKDEQYISFPEDPKDPCVTFFCPFQARCVLNASSGEPHCKCSESCHSVFAPVCGNDNITYVSECHLNLASCRKQKRIHIQRRGLCANPPICSKPPCSHGAVCVLVNGHPSCICPSCPEEFDPVCGSDGISYSGRCHLESEKCERKLNINVLHEGMCNICANVKCQHGSRCENGKCVCPRHCPNVKDPVCGTDGETYDNKCLLHRSSCEREIGLMVLHVGECEEQSGSGSGCTKKCDFYAVCELNRMNEEQCKCLTYCPEHEDLVCGTDDETYKNECELKIASCTQQKAIAVASKGLCRTCGSISCLHGSVCENGKCICPQNCLDDKDPVCASNGHTYANKCFLLRDGCKLGIDLEVLHEGECLEEAGSGDGCDETACRYGGTCIISSTGVQECKCDFTCPALRWTVCGSDGQTYGSECLMKEAACKNQMEITQKSMDDCEDIFEELCEGAAPMVNPTTHTEYNCSDDWRICPAGSYCHKTTSGAGCCEEDKSLSGCKNSEFGCCADKITVSPGPNQFGCPGFCKCDQLGSLSNTCDPISRQCKCKHKVIGLWCNQCAPGYWGFSMATGENGGCKSCGCSAVGSVRDDCDQSTGHCFCHPGVSGQRCNICPFGQSLGPNGCTNVSRSSLSSCANVICQYGASCLMRSGIPECVCPALCSANDSSNLPFPVCGSDRQMYGSQCQLEYFACRLQRNISVAYDGSCSATKGASFLPSSFLQLHRSFSSNKNISIELLFLPLSASGMLFYTGELGNVRGDFVSLALKDGFVEFRFELGGGPAIIKSTKKVEMMEWNRIFAQLFVKNGSLQLNDFDIVYGISKGSFSTLDFGNNLTFLGLVPTENNKILEYVGIEFGFSGCIGSLRVVDRKVPKQYNLTFPGSPDIKKGNLGGPSCINFASSTSPLCEPNLCALEATCPDQTEGSYSCICPDGSKGKRCEIAGNRAFNRSVSSNGLT